MFLSIWYFAKIRAIYEYIALNTALKLWSQMLTAKYPYEASETGPENQAKLDNFRNPPQRILEGN